MSKTFYDQKDQRVFYVFESAYGTPFGGVAWTAPPATFPYWQRFNIIGDAIDTPVPYRKKTLLYDIGSGKYPSHIVNEMYEPVDYTFEMELQDPAMFAYAIGDAAHAGLTEEDTDITCVSATNLVGGEYFFFEIIDGSADPELHYCWYYVGSSGSDPVIVGANAHQVDVGATDIDTLVASKTATEITGITGVTASPSGAVIEIRNDNAGSCIDARDGQDTDKATGFTFSTVVQGASTITITENLGHELQSFTMYVQQKNNAGAENLCKVYFGCIVDSWAVTIDRETHTVKQSISFKCPYAIDGIVSEEPPPINRTHPFTWNQLQTAELALGVSSTSYLPKSTTNLSLKIGNNVEIKAEVGSAYNQYPISAIRDVSMTIVGFTDSDDLYDLFEDIWNNTDGYLESMLSQLDSDINLERSATDYMRIYIYNWFVEEHDFRIFSITDAIKGVDLTVRGGTPFTNGELFHNGTNRPTIVSTDNLRKYHNT